MGEASILEVDGGNSSYKWRLLSGGAVRAVGRQGVDELAPGLVSVLQAHPGPVRARIASVAGQVADAQLVSVLQSLSVSPISFARVTRQRAGVSCGYEDLTQLGVDRWLALLAAANEFAGAIAVADFGTALTLDLVDAGRHHRGGYIIPGWRLLRQALLEGTAIDADRIPANYTADRLMPGLSSHAAIGQGRLLCLCSAVEMAVAEFAGDIGEPVRLICTGGDAPLLLPHLRTEPVVRPDLVLDGLALALD